MLNLSIYAVARQSTLAESFATGLSTCMESNSWIAQQEDRQQIARLSDSFGRTPHCGASDVTDFMVARGTAVPANGLHLTKMKHRQPKPRTLATPCPQSSVALIDKWCNL